jgi:hypothetical protein
MAKKLILPVALVSALSLIAQTPQPIPPNACTNSNEVGCVIPQLFGTQASGIILPNPFHEAHFRSSFQSSFTPLNSAIATQLTLLPLASPASGFTYEYDRATGGYVPSSATLGPILTERAETLGHGKFFFGTTYQRFRFGTIDGEDLRNLPAVFTHQERTGPPTNPEPAYEDEIITTTNSADLKIDQFAFVGTVGVTDRLDVSLAVPILNVRLNTAAFASIQRVALNDPDCGPPGGSGGICHYFDPASQAASTQTYYSRGGDSTGIGDLTMRIKGTVYSGRSVAIALATDLRFPTGDERDFLGSGAFGFRPFVAVSVKGRVAPHFNIGYQWNGDSVLAGNIVEGTKGDLPSQFFYSIGTDIALHPKVTVAADFLGQQLFDAPRVTRTTTPFRSASFESIGIRTDTFGMNNGSIGFKVNPVGRLLFMFNLLFRANSAGLRQDVTPLIGLSYTL